MKKEKFWKEENKPNFRVEKLSPFDIFFEGNIFGFKERKKAFL